MKKICFFVIVVIASISYVNGQNYIFTNLGVNFASESNSGGSSKFGTNLGIGYEQKLTRNFWLSPGVNYVSKGVKFGVVGNVTQFTQTINYLEVPLLLKYKYYFTNSINWSFVTGPSLSFATSAKNKFFSIGQPVTDELVIDKETGINPTDLGMNFGAELNFTVDYGYITVFTMYQLGLSSVLKDQSGNSIKNRVMTFGLQFKFGDHIKNPDLEDQ